MKKFTALLTILAISLSLLTIPAFAEMTTFQWPEHNTPIKHPGLMVMEHTVGMVIGSSIEERTHMTAQQMDEIITEILADENQELIPEELEVVPGRIAYLEDRTISCPDAPIAVHFRVWGTAKRAVLVFHLAEDSDQWQLVLAQEGPDVIPEFPGNGVYAVGICW